MSREFRGPEFAIGHAPPPPPQKERREPTPEEKATWAEAVAKNLHAASEHVTTCVAAMTSAHEARDVAGYESARQSADAGLSRLRELAAAAKEHAHDAKEDRVRTALETAGRLVADAESQWATAPAAPEPVAPTLACESALLAALPPLRHTGPIGPMFDKARADVARVFREQMPFSDFVAFQRIVREFGDQEIALRFARFSGSTQESLLGILADDHKLRVAARHRESAQRTQSTPSAPAPSATPTREPTSSEPAKDHATPSQVSADDPSAVAQRGIQGEGQPLPHGAQIQAAFGKHDVSGLRAHVGGEAGQVARQLGAEAFTTGNDVAFAESPSVDLVAHEATHHVQQRAGVALKSQLDEPGDRYEQQADTIGAKVKRGESVEADLDAIAGTGASATAAPARAVVQRKTADTAASGAPRRDPSGMPLYIDKHQNALRTEVARHLSETAWPDPASDLRWAPGGDHMFSATLWPLVARRLGDVDALCALLPQRKLDERFDRYVGTSAVSAPWSPAFGKAVGQLVEWTVRDALVERVGRRYRSIYASRHEPPEAEELVGGLPIDALVAHALVKCGGVDLFEIPAVEEQQGAAPTAATSARRQRAPQRGHKRALDAGHAASHDDDAPTRAQLMAIELQIGAKLTAIHGQVARLGFGDEVQAARDVHAHRVLLLDDADAATRKRYLPVLQFQHTQLLAIAPALAEVVPQYWPLRGVPDYALTPKRRADRDELAAQLEIYARAAAASHDKARSTAILRQLEERARWKERDRIDAAQVSAESAMDEMVSTTHSERVDREGLDAVRKQRQSMLDDTATGRSRYEQQKAATVAHETALRARMASARTALAQLRSAATDVFGESSAMREALGKLDERLKSLPEVILDVSDRISEVDRTWDAAIAARMLADPASKESAPAIQTDPNAPDDWAEWKARAGALPVAQQAFAKIAGDQQLGEFLKTAAKEIRDQAMVDAIVQLAAALAITVVTGMGAAALGRMVAGALIGEALPLAATSTRLAVAGLRIGIDIGVNVSINTAVQIAMSSGEASTGAVVLENALMEVFTRGLMHPLRTAQERALAYSRELSALPNLSAAERRALSRFDFAGTQMSAELLGSITTQWAARHIVATVHATGEEVSEPFALTVLQQGAAMGLGKFFHGQVAAWHAHKAALAKTRIGASAAAQELFAAREAFYARAKELSESLSPDPTAMHELLRMNEALLQQERALVDSHVTVETSSHSSAHEVSSAGTHERMRSADTGVSEHAHDAARSADGTTNVHAHAEDAHGAAHVHLESDTAPLGERIAALAGARYTGEGTFVLDGARGPIAVEVRRAGRLAVRHRGEGLVLEVPRGVTEPEMERMIAGKLAELAHREIEVALGHTEQEPGLSAQDHGLIAELRVLRRHEHEARALGPEGADQAARTRTQIEAVEKRLGLDDRTEASAQRRRMVETQISVQDGMAARAEEARRLGGDHGHPGIEVHNHFMGIVDAEVFRQRAATMDSDAGSSSWIPLLERLKNLPEVEKAYWQQKNPGVPEERFKSTLEHDRSGDRIVKRSNTGDAMDIIVEAHAQVMELQTRAADENNSTEDRAAFARAAEHVAEEASRTALSSTPETPFDGAYVLRGALVETTFGGGTRKPGETDADAEQRQYNDYIREALLRLAAEGIHYSEQSTGIGKLAGALHPDRIERVSQQLIAEGKIRPGQIEVKMLGMLKTSHFGQRDPNLPPVGKSGSSREKHDEDAGKALRQVERGGALGIDIGAPELMSFTPEGMNRWKAQLVELSNLGKATGNVQLSRPHVGEGAMDTVEGLPYHTDKNRHIIGDEPSHYPRARHNIEMMLDALESLPPGVLDPKYLMVRFGHVSHATPTQAARMKRLGVIAEVNLGSNAITGSISQTQSLHGPRAPTDRFDDHSLPTLIYYDPAVLLSTDGPDVMHTTLGQEYARARVILESVLTGELPVRISAADATVGDTVRGKEVSGRPDEREVRVWEMRPDERARFERGYKKLYEDAERYYRSRPKGNHGAAVDVSAYTQIATEHGLAPRFGHASFEGSRSAVETAVAAYQAAGYAISQSSADRGALAVVTSPDQQVTISLTVRTERAP